MFRRWFYEPGWKYSLYVSLHPLPVSFRKWQRRTSLSYSFDICRPRGISVAHRRSHLSRARHKFTYCFTKLPIGRTERNIFNARRIFWITFLNIKKNTEESKIAHQKNCQEFANYYFAFISTSESPRCQRNYLYFYKFVHLCKYIIQIRDVCICIYLSFTRYILEFSFIKP